MDWVDLYDEARRVVGAPHRRGQPIPAGLRMLVVCVWVSDGQGRLLLTKRAPEKRSCPNTWENSGGAALAGERSRQAIARELYEETGIQAGEESFVLIGSDKTVDTFYDFYFLRHPVPIGSVRLQEGETCDAKWVTMEEVGDMIAQNLLAPPIARRFQLQEELLKTLVHL